MILSGNIMNNLKLIYGFNFLTDLSNIQQSFVSGHGTLKCHDQGEPGLNFMK